MCNLKSRPLPGNCTAAWLRGRESALGRGTSNRWSPSQGAESRLSWMQHRARSETGKPTFVPKRRARTIRLGGEWPDRQAGARLTLGSLH